MFQIEFELNELQFLRGALEAINISGKDAKYVANLQIKLENEIADIHKLLQENEQRKSDELQHLVNSDAEKNSNK